MRKNRFDAQAYAAFLGSEGSFESSFAGQVNDVPGCTGIFKKSCKPPGAFGFNRLRPAGLVPLRPGLTFGNKLRLKPRDKLRVLTVRSDNHAKLLRERQCLIHFTVIDAKEIFVREKNFERRSAVSHNFAKLRFRFFAEF